MATYIRPTIARIPWLAIYVHRRNIEAAAELFGIRRDRVRAMRGGFLASVALVAVDTSPSGQFDFDAAQRRSIALNSLDGSATLRVTAFDGPTSTATVKLTQTATSNAATWKVTIPRRRWGRCMITELRLQPHTDN